MPILNTSKIDHRIMSHPPGLAQVRSIVARGETPRHSLERKTGAQRALGESFREQARKASGSSILTIVDPAYGLYTEVTLNKVARQAVRSYLEID
jgi:hypothetical protein